MLEIHDEVLIYSLSPPLGALGGNTSVTVLGANFVNGSTVCKFGAWGAVAATDFASTSEIVCLSPVASVAGVVSFEVSVNSGVDYRCVCRGFTSHFVNQ